MLVGFDSAFLQLADAAEKLSLVVRVPVPRWLLKVKPALLFLEINGPETEGLWPNFAAQRLRLLAT